MLVRVVVVACIHIHNFRHRGFDHLALRHARGEEALKLRCSLDTGPSHIRNVSMVDYLKQAIGKAR